MIAVRYSYSKVAFEFDYKCACIVSKANRKGRSHAANNAPPFMKAAALALALLSALDRAGHAEGTDAQTTPRAPASDRYDYLVAGASYNSLICATYLSKAGYRVLVLEAQNQIGGGCRTNDTMLAGFHEDWCWSVHGLINNNPVLYLNELQLDRYGYEQIHLDVVLHDPFLDGVSLTVFKNDLDRTAETIAQVSEQDAAMFRRLATTQPAELTAKTLAAMTGFAVARQVWQSPYRRAAALSGGKFNGPCGAELGTGRQAFRCWATWPAAQFPRADRAC